jgi:hypothetical protein
MFKYVIRNHQQKWQNFVDNLCQEFHISHTVRERFLHGNFTSEDSKWGEQIENFMNSHLPTSSRTLKCLAELKENPIDLDFRIRFSIVEILWLRKENGIDKEKAENVARNYGVSIIKPKVMTPSPYGYLPHIMNDIRGDFIWVVPGGTHFLPPMTAHGLVKILEEFSKHTDLSFFYDNLYTIIVRTEALCNVLSRGHTWPNDLSEQMKLFRNCNYRVAIQRMPLVELEPIYGGETGIIEEVANELQQISKKNMKKQWWKLW